MEDTSLEEALRDFTSRRSCDINFQADMFQQDARRFDSVAVQRLEELEQKFGVGNSDLFRSWVYFHWQWLHLQRKSAMTASLKNWVSSHVMPAIPKEQQLLAFCPESSKSSARQRGIFATGLAWQKAQENAPLWFLFLAALRCTGSAQFLKDTFFKAEALLPLTSDSCEEVVAALQLSIRQGVQFRTVLAAWWSPSDGRRRSLSMKSPARRMPLQLDLVRILQRHTDASGCEENLVKSGTLKKKLGESSGLFVLKHGHSLSLC